MDRNVRNLRALRDSVVNCRRKEATMIRYSVIIPQRDRAGEIRRQLPALTNVLTQLGAPHEIIVVDDGSSASSVRLLEKLSGECHSLRILRRERPAGTSVALAAGIRAARGETLVAIEAGESYPAQQIPWFLGWLQRADLVLGRRRQKGFSKLWQRLVRVPRWTLLGAESHDPDCLFWAARREALAEIPLEAGMARYLPALVARRGFRVCEAYVDHRDSRRQLDDVHPNLGDLLATWWRCRRWHDEHAYELTSSSLMKPTLRVVGSEEAALSFPTLSPGGRAQGGGENLLAVSPHPNPLPKGEGDLTSLPQQAKSA
jgi:dolichol-phosphate mannosyltransferase